MQERGLIFTARGGDSVAYGTRSPFHRLLSCLHVASTKPSTSQMRDWIFELLWDWLSQDLLKPGEISKTSLAGDKHHTGLVALFELKKKARNG